jgi:hypothetical protein
MNKPIGASPLGQIFFWGGEGGLSAKKGFQLLKLHYGFPRKKKSFAS